MNSHGQLNALPALSMYQKHRLMDIQQKFLPRTLEKFNGMIRI